MDPCRGSISTTILQESNNTLPQQSTCEASIGLGTGPFEPFRRAPEDVPVEFADLDVLVVRLSSFPAYVNISLFLFVFSC